jgi:hypothetical protein
MNLEQFDLKAFPQSYGQNGGPQSAKRSMCLAFNGWRRGLGRGH